MYAHPNRIVAAALVAACACAETAPSPRPPRRPDPVPYAPAPSDPGAGAQSGEVAGLSAGGYVSEARDVFVALALAHQREDAAAVAALLAPEVLVLRGQRRRSRDDLVRELGDRLFGRFDFEALPPEALVEIETIDVDDARAAAGRFPPEALGPDDLVVTGRMRFRLRRPVHVRDDPRTLVLRRVGVHLQVVVVDRWPIVP